LHAASSVSLRSPLDLRARAGQPLVESAVRHSRATRPDRLPLLVVAPQPDRGQQLLAAPRPDRPDATGRRPTDAATRRSWSPHHSPTEDSSCSPLRDPTEPRQLAATPRPDRTAAAGRRPTDPDPLEKLEIDAP